ncbi:MAG: DUF4836 family protein [Mediterranea sp.]|nr:DUF4836 family protein [Mediterranea sp.]
MEYTNVLPADASAVVSIDTKVLVDKAGLSSGEKATAQQKLLEAAKGGMSAEAYQQLEKVVKDPAESGIDVDAPLYWFSSPTIASSIVAKVADKGKLKASLDLMAKEGACQPVTETDGYAFTSTGENLIIFNPYALMLVTPYNESNKEAAIGLLKQEASKSFTQKKAFDKMKGHEGDIHFFVSLAIFPEQYAQQFEMALPAGIQSKDMSAVGGLNFDKGKIVLTAENYTENDSVKAIYDKQKKLYKKLNNKFVKNYPANSLMYMAYNLNGEGLYQMLTRMPQFKSIQADSEEATVLKQFLSSIDGELTFGLTNISGFMPTIVAYAEVNDGSALKTLYEQKDKVGMRGLIQQNDNQYLYRDGMLNLYLGVKDNVLYVTNDENVNKAPEQTVTPSVEEAPYAPEMKGRTGFVGLNVKAIFDLPMVKMAMANGGSEAKMYADLASKVSFLSVSSDSEKSEIELSLTDKDTNALKQIVDFAKQFTGM